MGNTFPYLKGNEKLVMSILFNVYKFNLSTGQKEQYFQVVLNKNLYCMHGFLDVDNAPFQLKVYFYVLKSNCRQNENPAPF